MASWMENGLGRKCDYVGECLGNEMCDDCKCHICVFECAELGVCLKRGNDLLDCDTHDHIADFIDGKVVIKPEYICDADCSDEDEDGDTDNEDDSHCSCCMDANCECCEGECCLDQELCDGCCTCECTCYCYCGRRAFPDVVAEDINEYRARMTKVIS